MDSRTLEVTLAAVWRGSRSVTIEALPTPEPGPGEVLVEITLATICGSDRHTVSGRRPSPCPSVLGHEAVGRIAAIGPGGATAIDGSALRPGDRVVWTVTVICGHCERCHAGLAAKCRTVRKVGHERVESGWALSGGYAERILLPAGCGIARVPDALGDAAAAPAACSTATVAAAIEAAGPLTGRRVLVIGAGMLGLQAVAMAGVARAEEIVVVDPSADRLSLAETFGATRLDRAVDPSLEVDLALDFSGVAWAIEAAVGVLDVAGRLVLVGSVAPGPPIGIDPERVVRRWLTITGVHNYEPSHLVAGLDFLAATDVVRHWADLVAPAVPLADIASLLVEAPRGRHLRSSVAP